MAKTDSTRSAPEFEPSFINPLIDDNPLTAVSKIQPVLAFVSRMLTSTWTAFTFPSGKLGALL